MVPMEAVNHAYTRIRAVVGNDCEELESVQLVETYRRVLRPSRVRVVLLAESHVFTSAKDRAIAIPVIPELPGYPTQYARFVYCLGYGERTLTGHPSHPSRDGTPQFWKIFHSCAHPVSSPADFGQVLKKTTHQERIRNKAKLLCDLKANGVWLVDTSIVALYKGGKKVPNMHLALRESWRAYTRDVVISSDPQHVICIGKGVARVIGDDLKRLFGNKVTTIAQPNARLPSAEHMANYQRYGSICLG
jgi:hypothetical protein